MRSFRSISVVKMVSKFMEKHLTIHEIYDINKLPPLKSGSIVRSNYSRAMSLIIVFVDRSLEVPFRKGH